MPHIPGLRPQPSKPAPTLEIYRNIVTQWRQQASEKQSLFLLIELTSTGEVIGGTGFASLSHLPSTDPPCHSHRPIRHHAHLLPIHSPPRLRHRRLRLTISHGFSLGLDEVKILILAANTAMAGLMETHFRFGEREAGDEREGRSDWTSPRWWGKSHWKVLPDTDSAEMTLEQEMCFVIEREKWLGRLLQ